MKDLLQLELFLLLMIDISAISLQFDANQGPNLLLPDDFELRLATTKWFFENSAKLEKMNKSSLRNKFNEFIVSEGFCDMSEKELDKAFNSVHNLQKKKKEFDTNINIFKMLKNNKEMDSKKGMKMFRFNQWSG